MSACLPVTAVPSLTEYSTNGMHEVREGEGEERDVLQTLSRCISMSTWGGEGILFPGIKLEEQKVSDHSHRDKLKVVS